ncbi:glycosyltransferase family 2 protein [Nocardiopsis aegyptia]|uniref:GT2 family glycosyltransferase n=1 Tax=Nocardiopsis aegyptia TaxID=220378 RepID=A0A7Z0EM90_9ACTN|nr:glycosyltransferase family 2 protein [Nocardiopsis aegyptia]NYJ34146.1 GT2 family glycosyltransferase [Nocardiopsis aegyptia]
MSIRDGSVRGRGSPGGDTDTDADTDAGGGARPLIRRNEYSVLDPPPLGGWDPVLGVSVVVPAHGGQEKLDLTLASLAAQSYPAELMEVVVVDDGSEPPLVLPPIRPEHTRLVVASSRGWGPGHAVREGVAASRAPVVLRLDADMVVDREHVEAQMRWHHLADYLAVMGGFAATDVPAATLDPEVVRDRVGRGEAAALLGPGTAALEWVTDLLEATDGLRSAGHRAWEVFTGATASVRRELFEAAAGAEPDPVMGEDSVLGYRLAQRGAVFVPERAAGGWHLGTPTTERRAPEAARFARPFTENRVPRKYSRRRGPGRTWEVPFTDVVVDTTGRRFDDVAETVDGLLSGDTADLRIRLVGEWSRVTPERHAVLDDPAVDVRLVHECYRSEPRVEFVGAAPDPDPDVPFRLLVSPGARPRPGAVRALTGAAEREGAGLVRVRGARAHRPEALRLERTAAFARARHLGADAVDRDAVVAAVWGVHVMDRDEVLCAEGAGAARPPRDWHARLLKEEAKRDRWRAEADRWERRIRALTRGRLARLLLGRRVR